MIVMEWPGLGRYIYGLTHLENDRVIGKFNSVCVVGGGVPSRQDGKTASHALFASARARVPVPASARGKHTGKTVRARSNTHLEFCFR